MARASPPLVVGAPDRETPADRPRWLERRFRPLVASAVALVVCVVLAVALWRSSDTGPPAPTRSEVDRAVQRGIDKARQDDRNAPPDAATAYRTIAPSLVTVTARGSAAAGQSQPVSVGAGVVVNAAGAVLTALHVVEDSTSIEVLFADGTQAAGHVLSSQASSDIAVLLVDRLPEPLVPAVMGGGPQVGDAVFPVGNPLGLRGTLTAGVVSAVDRQIRTDTGRTLTGLIQFDAAVNPGNSGGPLLDRNGRVVGIVTSLANPSKQPYFVGIGFAVPIGTASGVAGGPRQ